MTVNELLKKYSKTNDPPCTIIVGEFVFTEDKLLLGKVHS